MWGFQRISGAVVWSVLVVLQWAHASFIAAPAQWWLDNVVATAEETTKATVREYLSLLARVINGIASWIVAIFIDSDFHRKKKQSHRRSRAWKDFWARNKRGGTLNAVIEQEGFITRRSPSPSPRGLSPRPSRLGLPPQHTQQSFSFVSALFWPLTKFSSLFWSRSSPSISQSQMSSSFDTSSHFGMRRSGSDLFNRPSGFAVAERLERRGLSESLRISLELTIEAVFTAFRSAVSTLLFLRFAHPKAAATLPHLAHSSSQEALDAESWSSQRPRRAPPSDRGLRRTRSFGSWEDMGVWTASDVILQAGYPLEEHVVTTSDGYVLTMQRIPRKGSKNVVFFQHGILDTSLGWVSNGVQGSQAFAAYDRGADVWLGNCRANPPRAHADGSRSGAAYWCYSINELGMEDVAAQIYRIHAVKLAELGGAVSGAGVGGFMASVVGGDAGKEAQMNASPRPGLHKRSGSDSALAAVHNLAMATERLAAEVGAEAIAPPNEEQIKAFNLAMASNSSSGNELRSHSLDAGMPKRRWSGGAGNALKSLNRAISTPSMASMGASSADNGRIRRRGSLSRLFMGRSSSNSNNSSTEASSSGPPPAVLHLPDGETTTAAQRLQSFRIPIPDGKLSPIEDGPAEEEGEEAEVTSALFPPRPTPISIPTPEDSAESTPRSANPPVDRFLTPDRISIGGREQAPLQWAKSSTMIGQIQGPCPAEPYQLQAVGHSLGGASLLIYAVMCRVLSRPHHLSRLVLLTPGGFHRKYPKVATPFLYILPVVMRLLTRFRPGIGAPAYIPSSLLRYITFKLTVDLQQVPALNELLRAALRLLLNGDASEWDRALQMPHYAVASMPAISLHTGSHLMQLMSSGKFLLYDYGSAAANRKHYGTKEPPDVAAHYHLLAGLPVDLVAGRSDGVIAREDVMAHYEAMKAAGLEVTLKELNVGHLDVTFAVKDEVQHYVMSRLKLRGGLRG